MEINGIKKVLERCWHSPCASTPVVDMPRVVKGLKSHPARACAEHEDIVRGTYLATISAARLSDEAAP